MGKSIDPMWKEKAGSDSRAHSRRSSASMSLQPAIPWRVALQQCPPPLHRPASECDKLTLPVNQHRDKATEPPRSTPTAARSLGSLNRKTERPLKNRRKLSEQPGPPQFWVVGVYPPGQHH